MIYTHMVQNLFLFGAVLVACGGGVSDLHSARVPNWLTYSGIISSPHPELNVCQPGTLRVPFGVAIAMGTLLCTANVIWWR